MLLEGVPGLKLLFVDNFDSFTYNVAELFSSAGAAVEVVLGDDARLSAAGLEAYDALVLGPGPGNPRGAPGARRMLDAALNVGKPVFGVCLGLQAIAEYFGATIGNAPQLMHGKTSRISHDGTGVFAGVPNPFTATRYHSLCVLRSTLPGGLVVSATSEDGTIQGLAHADLPVTGVQFHPESILSEHGKTIARNFLSQVSGTAGPGHPLAD